MAWSVFDATNRAPHTEARAFLDDNGSVSIQRYDTMKYPSFDKLTDKQLGYFWRPQEVNVSKDSADFRKLDAHEQHIFTSNLKRQILLDSTQGKAPNLAFLPIVSLPEIETWITTWSFSETIHSRSYTYIIQNVYADPSKVFNEVLDIQEIVDCADDISKHYDHLIELSMWYRLLGEGNHTVNGKTVEVRLYAVKKALWMAIMSVNILEGVRFYASFACSWMFAELKKMEGNAKIIKFICRDENLHLASTQLFIKTLPKDDPDFAKIAEETMEESIELFRSAVTQEKEWAKFLFKDGSMIGLNEELLCDYVDWVGNKRMVAAGLPPLTKTRSNPLPWTEKWISGSEVQTAPQETEISSYRMGDVNNDVSSDSFKGFSL